jgi:hypothetical protein
MTKILSFSALSLVIAFTFSPLLAAAAAQTPIDGGSSILLIAGISYAGKKLAAKRKRVAGEEK